MSLQDKFLRYVKVDTESKEFVEEFPSTKKQFDLLNMLAFELEEMGAIVDMDKKYGYVYATIPATEPSAKYKLGFIGHVDTSFAVSGKDVSPVITRDYDLSDIKMSDGYTLSPKDYPTLLKHKGKTIICSDGSTLLGADDKAGVAEIMMLAETLLADRRIKHGEIKIAFTPDEEVGRGADFFDVARFNADYAYTVDGGELGDIEYENFNAASGRVDFVGKSIHPGDAKGKMINASLVLMELQNILPVFENPMYTEGYEGFYHMDNMSGTVDKAHADYIIRDHDRAKFEKKKEYFISCCDFLNKKYGVGTVNYVVKDSYYNMYELILPHKAILIDTAIAAMKKEGVTPLIHPIRGGTDGARLTYMGLPCPNLNTGGYNFHGRYEYAVLEDMEKITDVLLNIVVSFGKMS